MIKLNRLLRYRKYTRQLKKQVLEAASQYETIGAEGNPSLQRQYTTSTVSTDVGAMSQLEDTDNEDETDNATLGRLSMWYRRITVILWRVSEIHAHKFVSFVIMMVVIQQVSNHF